MSTIGVNGRGGGATLTESPCGRRGQRIEGFKFKGEPTQYALFRSEFANAPTCYPHNSAQKLDALVRMLVEPAKSVIADCCTISDLNMALIAAWDTLHGVYSH